MLDDELPWYSAGLAFECSQCGSCCAGPAEGYIWLNEDEIIQIAAFLKITPEEVRKRFIRKVAGRYSLIEEKATKDCVFLSPVSQGARRCIIYDVRPQQCRTWPFWKINIADSDSWAQAQTRCPGINRGKILTRNEIERRSRIDAD